MMERRHFDDANPRSLGKVGRIALTALALAAAGCSTGLPPEAFGTFEGPRDSLFQTRIEVGSDYVEYSTRVNIGSRQGSTVCRAPVSGGVRARMALDLVCSGDPVPIPFEFEWRGGSGDWLVTEDGDEPQAFSGAG